MRLLNLPVASVLAVAVLSGCAKEPLDVDGDGYSVDDGDCNDNDPSIYPSAGDSYGDGADQNCDGADGVDSDGDGWASELSGGDDCDDSDSETYSGADDSVGDDVDQNCDGIDGVDGDGDGGASEDSGGDDCNDSDEDVYAGAADPYGDGSDQNCDGMDGVDADGDGFASDSGGGDDCDDSDSQTYPGADEYCDGHDDDCDGEVDEDDAVDVSTWYADSDSDGFGDAATSDIACYQPFGYVLDNTDCDDTDGTEYPGADEICDGDDDNCDGDIDEDDAVDVSTWYADSDNDGFGDASSSDVDCYQPAGYVADATDCDDGESTTYPGADEYCDGVNNDCDSETDEDDAVDVATWYADSDNDGEGDAAVSDIDCYQPTGYVSNSTDCNDSDSSLNTADADQDSYSTCAGDCDDTDGSEYPGADEYCDGDDDDCDGDIDENDAVDVSTWYADSDNDGEGDAAVTDITCYQPTGYVANSTDCNDSDSSLNTADADQDSQTTCAGDCDDNDATAYVGVAANEPSLCTHDDDADGYGDAAAVSPLDAGTDCDDDDATAYVGVAANESSLCTHDFDMDGYGDAAAASPLDAGTDCDDNDATAYPGVASKEPSLCTHDDDQDGWGDENATAPLDAGLDCDDSNSALNEDDLDQDTHSTCDDDCDDSDATAYPGVAYNEPSLCTHDDDGDGWGDGSAVTPLDVGLDCDDSSAALNEDDADNDTYSTCDDDCDDTDATAYPGVAYNEPSLCTHDDDGDGYGDNNATSPLDSGTDCDDADNTRVYAAGLAQACAVASCSAILSNGFSSGDGTYWLDPDADGLNAFEAYCDMTTDGGGWTMVYSNFHDQGNLVEANAFASSSSSHDREYSTSASTISRARYEVSVSEILFIADDYPSGTEVTSIFYGTQYDSVLEVPKGTSYTYDSAASNGHLVKGSCAGMGTHSPNTLYISKSGADHRNYFFSSYDTDSWNQAGYFCHDGPHCNSYSTGNTIFADCNQPSGINNAGYVEIFVR